MNMKNYDKLQSAYDNQAEPEETQEEIERKARIERRIEEISKDETAIVWAFADWLDNASSDDMLDVLKTVLVCALNQRNHVLHHVVARAVEWSAENDK